MHQPVYELEGTYLMPWVRLHAVKDYLDMALYFEKFPKLKLNFDVQKFVQKTFFSGNCFIAGILQSGFIGLNGGI